MFSLGRGGMQGSTDAPFLWNVLDAALLLPLAQRWTQRGFGMLLPSGVRHHHHHWADDLTLVSDKIEHLIEMYDDLLQACVHMKLSLACKKTVWTVLGKSQGFQEGHPFPVPDSHPRDAPWPPYRHLTKILGVVYRSCR